MATNPPVTQGGDKHGKILPQFFEAWGTAPRLSYDEDELAKPRLDLWAASSERDWYIRRRAYVFLFAILSLSALLLAAVLLQPGWRSDRQRWWGGIFAVVGCLSLLYCTMPYIAARGAFRTRVRKSAVFRSEHALYSLTKDADENALPLTSLFTLNRKQLDAYQDISRRQQRTMFMLAQVACIAGFAVLLTGAIISVTRNNDPDKFVTAGLTALGTLLSGFLGATFLHSARRADRRLSLYYQEPHMFGRILVAERLNKVDLPAVAADKLITALLEWPFPIDSDAEAPTKPEKGQESGKALENGAEKPVVAS